MRGSASFAFSSPDEFGSKLSDLGMEILVNGPGRFQAQLSYVECDSIRLVLCHEWLPRIGRLAIAADRVCLMFQTNNGPSAKLGEFEVSFGDVALLGAGHRCHMRTPGDFRWAAITFDPRRLPPAQRALIGEHIRDSDTACIFKPTRPRLRRLSRLLRRAVEAGETAAELLHIEGAAKGLEAALADAAIACVSGCSANQASPRYRQQTRVLNRFDDLFQDSCSPALEPSQVAAALGVPVQEWRECCSDQLGMSPESYMRLRQLNKVRRDLEHADPMIAEVADIAARRSFADPVEFAAEYRELFGETPSTTLHRTVIGEDL